MAEPIPTPRPDHLLPYDDRDATPLERAISGEDARLLQAPHNVIRAAWNPDTCPVHLLPYLAQAWSVDEWDPAWSEAQKRQVIKDSPAIHRRKGTAWALKAAIAQIGIGARVREWFEYDGAPYTFRLELTLAAGASWTARQARQLYRVAVAAKNVRSWLSAIRIDVTEPAPTVLAIGAAVHTRMVIETYIGPVTEMSATAYLRVAAVSHTRILIDTPIAA